MSWRWTLEVKLAARWERAYVQMGNSSEIISNSNLFLRKSGTILSKNKWSGYWNTIYIKEELLFSLIWTFIVYPAGDPGSARSTTFDFPPTTSHSDRSCDFIDNNSHYTKWNGNTSLLSHTSFTFYPYLYTRDYCIEGTDPFSQR